MSVESTVVTILQDIAQKFKNGEQDVETFVMSAASYAVQNIKPAVFQAVADAMAAAEADFASDPSIDKAEMAFDDAVAALEKDGTAFVVADIKFAQEAVIQARNARTAPAVSGA